MGLDPAQTADLRWLADGEPRRMFIAGGSDAHGDWNYRREGYLRGLTGVTDTAIGRPRNLVFVPRIAVDRSDRVSEDPTADAGDLRAPTQAEVTAALEAGNFSATNGPAVRIVIDENQNGIIDAGDRPMGGVSHLYGERRVPVLLEWMTTEEFGAIQSIELVVGMLDTGGAGARVWRGSGPIVRSDSSLTLGDTEFFDQGHDIFTARAPYGSSAEERNLLAITFSLDTPAGELMHGTRAFEIDLTQLRAPNLAIAENVFVRALVVTRAPSAACSPSAACALRGEVVQRRAYTNPVWAISRPIESCTTDTAALDDDADGIPDGCDPCRSDDTACTDADPTPPSGGVGPSIVGCYEDPDLDGYAEYFEYPIAMLSDAAGNCPSGYVSRPPTTPDARDCAPHDASVHPGASEWCDPSFFDRNCDPTDEGTITCYRDVDGDGFGGGAAIAMCPTELGDCQVGYVSNGADCCDTDVRAFPGQSMSFGTSRIGCSGFDFDCNGAVTQAYGLATSCLGRSASACASAPAGFASIVACGASGSYYSGCTWSTWRNACATPAPVSRVMTCR
jgi:hypothetical protein